jgi:hypothetical protein
MQKPRDWIDYAQLGAEVIQVAQLSTISDRLDVLTRIASAQVAAQAAQQDSELRRLADEASIREFVFQGERFIRGLRQAHLTKNPRGTLVLTLGLDEQVRRYNLKTSRVTHYEDKQAVQRFLDGVAALHAECTQALTQTDLDAVATCVRYKADLLRLEAALAKARLVNVPGGYEARAFMRVFGPDIPASGHFYAGTNPWLTFLGDRMPKADVRPETVPGCIDRFMSLGYMFVVQSGAVLLVYSQVNPRVSSLGLAELERMLGMRNDTSVIWVNNNRLSSTARPFFSGQPDFPQPDYAKLRARPTTTDDLQSPATTAGIALNQEFGEFSKEGYESLIRERQAYINEVTYGTSHSVLPRQ